MSKKTLIFSTILLLAIVSVSYLSVSPVKTGVEVDDDQDDLNITILSTPRSSGYDVTERWKYASTKEVEEVAVSADGKYMAVGTNNDVAGSELFFFDTSSNVPLWGYDMGYTAQALAISANGSYIVAAAGVNPTEKAYLFNSSVPEAGQDKKEVWTVDDTDISAVDISGNGSLIVVGGDFGVRVYNNTYPSTGLDKTNEYLWTNDTGDTVSNVAISSNGKYVVANQEQVVYFWNTTEYVYNQEHAPMWSYDVGAEVNSLAISDDGEYIAAGDNANLYVFNKTADGGAPEWSDFLNYDIYSVAISENGSYIAIGADPGVGGEVRLYSNSTRTSVWAGTTAGEVNSVDITENGTYVVAGTKSADNTLFLFNSTAEGGNKLPEWSYNTTADVNSVSISSDGKFIGVGGDFTSGINQGVAYLFYHGPPTISPLVGGGDDDDDDDDTGVVVVVVVIIIIASAGGVVVVIIVLIKKGIIDLSKLKRK